ncbi:uncharacterized protein LOC107264985 isoform X2 [Cephus cinctus]|uniref:UBX domain-containing protein 11 n=1 Tax=Cephus cinctus TaxID=211228 RepID=A0AAJ7RCN4_CEPCN|nr:uncharacterized protein LOC107264985 isoform X2 [Cephus cinctus]
MSNKKGTSPTRKKNVKNSSLPAADQHDKLKKTTSTSSLSVENKDLSKNLKPNIQQRSSKITNFSRLSVTSNESSNEREKSWNNFARSSNYSKLAGQGCFNRDGELIGMLSKELYLAENQMQRMQAILMKAEDRLKLKDQEIGRLRRKIKDWEAKSKNQELLRKKEQQDRRNQVQDSEYVHKRCLMLEHKIYEMEKFLADYGLIWVGESGNRKENQRNSLPKNYIESCYTRLTANIEELNMAVGKGEVQVHRNEDGGGASFKTASCMCLKFYKNGMILQNGPLRSYSNPKTESFIRDIIDGYFPSELQQAYPNGVPFKVEDHRLETYLVNGVGFPGQGYRLGKNSPDEISSRISSKRFGTGFYDSSRHSVTQRQQFYSFDPTTTAAPNGSARSIKSKCSLETTKDLNSLRSKILASHNNNCSDTHLQSHINAELALSGRSEKKRDLATRSRQYHISVREKTLKSQRIRLRSSGTPSGSRASNLSSIDRSPIGISPSRSDSASDGNGSRSRSTSLTGDRFKIRSLSRLRMSFLNLNGNHSHSTSHGDFYSECKKPRITRSDTLDRNTKAPLIRQINQSSGQSGELRIKVRSLSGSTVFLMHVFPNDSVERLYQLLNSVMPKAQTGRYKIIISGYFPKRLDCMKMSLREYGIVRDSVLHLVNV